MSKRYKIGIDARLLSQTGVGTYLRNLLYYLQQLKTSDFIFYVYLIKKDWQKIHFAKKNFLKREADFYWHSFSEQIGFLSILYQDDLDLMYFSYFSYPILYRRPFFSTIHDLTPLYLKTGKSSTRSFFLYQLKRLGFRLALKNQVERSLAIITPTRFVRDELIKIYGEKNREKIFPLYEGVSYELLKAKENLNLKERFIPPFFIYVGNFYPHKNLQRLIEAYSRSKDIFPKLILIGPDDFFKKRLAKFIAELDLTEKILFYSPQSFSDLVFFYKRAEALIHPSLSEGFGLPLIEASYFHCPVIASKIKVFQEIMDGEYLTFDPFDIEDINKKIKDFLTKKFKFNYEKINSRYSFRKMTQNWLKVVTSLLNR